MKSNAKKIYERCVKEEKKVKPDSEPCPLHSAWEETPECRQVFALRDKDGRHIVDYVVRGFDRISVFRIGDRYDHGDSFNSTIAHADEFGSDTESCDKISEAVAGLVHVEGREQLERTLLYLMHNDAPVSTIVAVARALRTAPVYPREVRPRLHEASLEKFRREREAEKAAVSS